MSDYKELQTIRDFIRWAVSRFNEAGLTFGHGTETAWDEAVALILHSLYLPHDINPTVLDARITEKERLKLLHLISERTDKRIPVPYLTHEAWFAGLSFYVDERVLIPRSPLAEIIEKEFQPWIPPHSIRSILDLCTGSGCIAIACAMHCREATIDASDVSEDALAVAKTNIIRHNLENQVHLFHSNLFESLPPKQYDIIISNPPYVDAEDMNTLPPEYLHEPQLGLIGGPTGLELVLKILQNAPHFLSPQGVLIVEVGNSEHALIEQFPEIPFTWLEFERGGGGVFLLTQKQLLEFQDVFSIA